MKLDPIFTVKENKLYKIEDDSLIDTTVLKQIEIPWTTVELDDEVYNEEYLASLREDLKSLETTNTFAILVPVIDKPMESEIQIESFINAYNHTARRVKDCTSVAGFELPEQLSNPQDFIDVLVKKHAHYVYFTKGKNPASSSIVMY